MIKYNHENNIHNQETPSILLPVILSGLEVSSLLDVGAGTGVWINAARESEIIDCVGVDGIVLNSENLKCEAGLITQIDLTQEFRLGRSFDVALCLEVAEHLPASAAPILIQSIVNHADLCFFSAAIPGQDGQNHINCQWPEYWQYLFNEFGFMCVDDIRPKIWNVPVDPWYKQNMFRAFKSLDAGSEPRIASLIHPEMLQFIKPSVPRKKRLVQRVKNVLNIEYWWN